MHPENERQQFSALADRPQAEAEERAQDEDAASSGVQPLPEAASEDARSNLIADEAKSGGPARTELPLEPGPELDPATTLSPAVRRLVRQYDLDITGIHGTGPSGRIRVGDVMGVLGARTEASARLEAAARTARADRELVNGDESADPRARAPIAAAAASSAQPMTTVFECDLSRVLSHRKKLRQSGTEVLVTSYYLVGCAEALRAVREIGAIDGDGAAWPRFGALLASTEDELRSTLVDASAAADGSLDERLLAFDRALRASGQDDLGAAALTVHHYGLSGSLLATPLPLGPGQAASVGIGRARRSIVIKTTDGEEAPRVGAMCYITVTFAPERITLQRANRFLAHVVRTLEHWPS
jgi:pyruvate/2-oxoglutarate dehydrogenase complex dihydrolipoamide acyltransferase (E2) component